jgi:uncharacterized protein (DUF697 family)
LSGRVPPAEILMLAPYEQRQISLIRRWKARRPFVISKLIGLLLFPLTWLLNRLVPDAAIRAAFALSSYTGQWLADTNDIKRDAGVTSLADLKNQELEKLDKIANGVRRWAIVLAAVEGAVTGAIGIFGLAFDTPSIVILSFRTIHKVGACYGFEVESPEDHEFIFAILATSSASSLQEKTAAIAELRAVQIALKQTWKSMTKKAGEQVVGREAGIIALKKFAAELGIKLTKRKALQAIPIIGAVVGALVNSWYMYQVGWAARRAFQERWLAANGKIDAPIEPETAPVAQMT